MSTDPAARHREHAGRFTEVARDVADWDAPTPVAGWRARDVPGHLVGWFPAFLAAGGVELPAGPPVAEDPVAAWEHQALTVQRLLAERGDESFTHPHAGTHRLADAVDRFYTADVVMHTWDLARASGQEPGLGPDLCAEMLAGMRPIEALLRDSGQYGPAVPVPEDASPQDRLMGFVGRDPAWAPPA